jgi:hypothetical protein
MSINRASQKKNRNQLIHMDFFGASEIDRQSV